MNPDLLQKDIQYLKGVGEKRAACYRKLGVDSLDALLHFYPRQYRDLSNVSDIKTVVIGELCLIRAVVAKKFLPKLIRKGMTIFKVLVADETDELMITIFNNKYAYDGLLTGKEYLFYGRITGMLTAKEINAPLIYPVDKAMEMEPIYSLTQGLTNRQVITNVNTMLKEVSDSIRETLPESIRMEKGLLPLKEALVSVHRPQNKEQAEKAKRRLAFDELLGLMLSLSLMKQRHKITAHYVMNREIESKAFWKALPFKPTGAQLRAIREAVEDLCSGTVMQRLLQGDVGSGKTLVAAALCFFAIQNGYQCALMAPTEILSVQHYKTFSKLLLPLGMRVELLTGSTSQKNKREMKQRLAAGEVDIIIGTHALIQGDVEFAKLGLVITDEQHRFGVSQRASLAAKGENPHVLVMSATPIPRTLALILYGDLDLSVLDEMPPGRQTIETYALSSKQREKAYELIRSECLSGRQCYVICPMVEDGEEMGLADAVSYGQKLQSVFPQLHIRVIHGQQKQAEKDAVMAGFSMGEIQILVSTTVVEVGVDVPNATVMLIENAERFGLSQLHQLRGRIGRGREKSYCLMITDSRSSQTLDRIRLLTKTSDGFEISRFDLEQRGPGEFFGNRQHGLPELSAAASLMDFSLVNEVKDCCDKILQEDPLLLKDENEPLKRLTARLIGRLEAGRLN